MRRWSSAAAPGALGTFIHVGEEAPVALDAGVGHVALADRHLVVHRVEDALVLAHEILDVLGLQSLETLAHAGDGRAARVLVVDQRVVEIEEDRANHFTAVNG
jgi:hypothetical protein